jgi:hypothetical protein
VAVPAVALVAEAIAKIVDDAMTAEDADANANVNPNLMSALLRSIVSQRSSRADAASPLRLS